MSTNIRSINILDENDSPPVLQYPSAPIQISEYHDQTEQIAHIRATDADDPATPNGRIEFRLIGGTGSDLFKLQQRDPWNCALFAKRQLHDYYGNYTVRVQARDLGEPPNSVEVELNVMVLDFNDHAPYFVAPGLNVTVRVPEVSAPLWVSLIYERPKLMIIYPHPTRPQNATVGTHIVQVRAVDDDVGPNAAILYRFKPDSLGNYRTFHIDPTSGAITLRQPLDRERQKLYDVRIEAYDQGVPPLTSDLDLAIYVRNVNDYEPQFLVDELAVEFTEHQPAGAERIKLPDTVDRDEVDDLDDPPSQVCYFIVYGNGAGRFQLDARTHVLTVLLELDREQAANHTLVVRATEDCARTPAPLSLAALVEHLDSRLSYQAALTRAKPEREDRRTPAWFNRYKHSRSVRSVRPADAADMPQPTLSFDENVVGAAAADVASPPAPPAAVERRLLHDALQEDGTLVQIHVRVLDINDNAPQFASKVFTGGLTTTTDFGATVMRVHATDADEGANAAVRYYQTGDVHRTLAEGLDQLSRPPFLVDAETGAIVLNFDPQRGMKGYFDFMVLVNDTAGQQDVAHVFIYLLRDDQRVKFVLRQQPAWVRERIGAFRAALGNVTEAIVNVDDFKVRVCVCSHRLIAV